MRAAAASVVATLGTPGDLLLCGAVVFACAGLLPEYLSRKAGAPAGSTARRSPGPSTPQALGDGYVGTLLVLVGLTTIGTTGIDFLFKSVAQRNVAPESLASFFASFYAGVNLVALVVQPVATRRLILLFGPSGTLAALASIGLVGAAYSDPRAARAKLSATNSQSRRWSRKACT